MKLKRLLCALVVFTLMMTSVVCSVSAATYQTTTVYNAAETAGDLGTTSLKTTISGLNTGSMVSYIIYEGTKADPDPTLKEDGSNIVYIDQQTAGADGTLVFGEEAKFVNAGLLYNKYTFATSGDETFEYDTLVYGNGSDAGTANSKAATLPVNKAVANANFGVTFAGYASTGSIFPKSITISGESTYGTFLTKELVNTSGKTSASLQAHPGTTITIDVVPQDGQALKSLTLTKTSSTSNGGDSYGVGGITVTSSVIGGKYKFHMPTLNASMTGNHVGKFDPGSSFQVKNEFVNVSDTATAKYIKVDSAPIYETLEDGSKAVTFLMTKSATIADDACYGINLYAIPVDAASNALSNAEATFENMQALKATNNKFGIQLITNPANDNAKYFDPAQYDLVVVPYYGETEDAAAALKGVDSSASLFYTVDGLTDLTDSITSVTDETISE